MNLPAYGLGKKMAIAVALGAVASTLVATPSFAASSSCGVGNGSSPGGFTCETGVITANSSGHYVNFKVNSLSLEQTRWYIYDIANGHKVQSGVEGTFSSGSGRVTGLYGSYRLRLQAVTNAAAGLGKLSN